MRRIFILSTVAATLFIALIAIELVQNPEPLSAGLLAAEMLETGLLVLAVVATAYFSVESREYRRRSTNLQIDLAKVRADAERWRGTARAHIEGLGNAIKDQFDNWGLTESESDIAASMLKGLSHKEIARLRQTSEATVRQQARAIYRKSGLSSRAELAAFFLEDLLLPIEQRGGQQAQNIAFLVPKK